MKRFKAMFIALSAALLMSGCGTTLNMIAGKDPFGGVQAEARVIAELDENPILSTLALCDLPLTVVGDTISIAIKNLTLIRDQVAVTVRA